MTMVLASRNLKKIAEMRTLMAELLPEVEVLSLDDVGVTEDIVEDGATFEENALIKARVAARGGRIGSDRGRVGRRAGNLVGKICRAVRR